MQVSDLVLQRVAASPESTELSEIPWPASMTPKPWKPVLVNETLPAADILVVTYTAAEADALADVLTPGVKRSSWLPYVHGWDHIVAHLTDRSPAREAKCLAQVYATIIDNVSLLLVHSELHLSTDGETLPIRTLLAQMIGEVSPDLVVTTGTAGGVGTEVLGDVLVTGAAKFNCTRTFAKMAWAQQRFVSDYHYDIPLGARVFTETWPELVAANAGRLHESGYAPRPPRIVLGDVETVDYFAFADVGDSYGVVRDDPQVAMEEMDDAVVALVCEEDLHGAQAWVSVRNASDPQMGDGSLSEQKHAAEEIYERYGYYTSIGSVLAVWALAASMAGYSPDPPARG